MKSNGLLFSTFIAISLAFGFFGQHAFANQLSEVQNFNLLTVLDSQYLLNNDSSIYQKILDEMNLEYENIGKREANRVLHNNSSSITGGLNSIGFNYQRPFADFSISVDRNLAPDLFDSKRWIVTDTFSVLIDASRVLSNLKDSKVIDLSEKNLAAFAGIVFKRSITWVHFANSYNEGLTTHFEKLFLPFNALNFSSIQKIASNEMIYKEDYLSIKGGGIVSAPLYSGVTGMAGVLAKFEKLSKVEVISTPTKGGSDNIMITSEKKKSVSTGVSASIQMDFLKILKFTLLSYDFTYELDSSYKIYLSLTKDILKNMDSVDSTAIEIAKLLKNREGNLALLAPFIISEEKRIAKASEHKYNFLLLGGSKKSKTQQIEITTNGVEKTFFKHFYEKVKYSESLVSRFFSSLIYALTHKKPSAVKLAADLKKSTIEYESTKDLINAHENLNIDDINPKLSVTFEANFSTKKTKGRNVEKYRDRAIYFLERYSGVDPLAVNMVKSNHLVAPFEVNGRYQVNLDGVKHLNSLSISKVFDHINALCDEYPRNKFFNFRSLFDNCRRSMQNDYVAYYNDLSHDVVTSKVIKTCENESAEFSDGKKRAFLKQCLSEITYKSNADRVDLPLWSFKTLTTNIVNNCNSKVHYYNLFGVQNVFFYGYFNAQTTNGLNFSTHFHEGAFKGLGVVDHYMRLENLRAPSSVVVDQ